MNSVGTSCGPRGPDFNRALVIGLVNNSSGRAQKMTKEQFSGLLHAASPGIDVELRLFTCLEGPLSHEAWTSVEQPYEGLESLFSTRLDALIVTGMEPQAAALPDEPAWGNITKLVDWADCHAVPVIWSCLAAHAAVLYLDGISRRPLPKKVSGVFGCDLVAADHPLMSGLSPNWVTPHSRYNGLQEESLAASGYQILSRSEEAGVDIFLKERSAPFVFFQGHPEYDTSALLREYKRDMRRFLLGERRECPSAPRHYFEPRVASVLTGFQQEALRSGRFPASSEEVFSLVDAAVSPTSWTSAAVGVYSNWLAYAVRDLYARHPVTRVPQARTYGREPVWSAVGLVQ